MDCDKRLHYEFDDLHRKDGDFILVEDVRNGIKSVIGVAIFHKSSADSPNHWSGHFDCSRVKLNIDEIDLLISPLVITCSPPNIDGVRTHDMIGFSHAQDESSLYCDVDTVVSEIRHCYRIAMKNSSFDSSSPVKVNTRGRSHTVA
jgi:hypothetical protein